MSNTGPRANGTLDFGASSPRIVIIGAGAGGLITALSLKKRLEYSNFTIFEKGFGLGGTWRENTYPGCACDTDSHWYSISSDPNPSWSQTYPEQAEILAYLTSVADKHRLQDHCEYGCEFLSGKWDEQKKQYTLTIQRRALSSGPEDAEPTDPQSQKSFSAFTQWVFKNVPGILWLFRLSIFLTTDITYLFFITSPVTNIIRRVFEARCRRYIRQQAPKQLHDDLMPNYPLGCKRIVRDSGYLNSLNRPNVEVIWDPITEIAADGVVTKPNQPSNSGVDSDTRTTHTLDVLILATGFDTRVSYALPLEGRQGTTIKSLFSDSGGPIAYRGTTIPFFPNMFMLSGPNTINGHVSTIYMEEVQVNYILNLITPILEPWLQHKRWFRPRGPKTQLRTLTVEPTTRQRSNITRSCKGIWRKRHGQVVALVGIEMVWGGIRVSYCSPRFYTSRRSTFEYHSAVFPGYAVQWWASLRNVVWRDFSVVREGDTAKD
ncbi:uncharacterized protein EI90DRAFT_3129469 [Cantharellus anzutake]|uniref:uncharacterized protein n=1 Tax=Cantharellus anzutake TaxID=1750568 RepID=UPI001906BB4F|nr:uncharacterized protein EI90DRAFT_3129469 [Cantharellus anzutake]KAF8324919.1 hypothetical protein EI90DRAFT_3129469 [Cantharellus anzutake]